MKRLLLASVCAALAACSSSEEAKAPSTVAPDAAADTSSPEASSPEASSPEASSAEASSPEASSPEASSPEASSPEASSPEASSPDGGPAFETCENTCAQTKLTLIFGNNTAFMDRAQFGFNAPVGGKQTLHVEAHFGGDPACPTQTSPSPDRTVIFGVLPIPTDATPVENTPVTFLDFKGDLSANPFDKATAATLTPVAVKTTPADGAFIAFDVNVTFPSGTMTGHVYATHCDSMDE